jgi:hypothetical protein
MNKIDFCLVNSLLAPFLYVIYFCAPTTIRNDDIKPLFKHILHTFPTNLKPLEQCRKKLCVGESSDVATLCMILLLVFPLTYSLIK